MVSVVLLSVIILSIIKLSVINVQCHYAECSYAEYPYAGRRYAQYSCLKNLYLVPKLSPTSSQLGVLTYWYGFSPYCNKKEFNYPILLSIVRHFLHGK